MAIDSKPNGNLKLHLDVGTHKCKLTNKDVNLWGSIDTFKDHSLFNFNFGANIFTKDLDISTRISTRPNDNCNLCLTTKILRRFGNMFFGAMTCEKLCPAIKVLYFLPKIQLDLYFTIYYFPFITNAKSKIIGDSDSLCKIKNN